MKSRSDIGAEEGRPVLRVEEPENSDKISSLDSELKEQAKETSLPSENIELDRRMVLLRGLRLLRTARARLYSSSSASARNYWMSERVTYGIAIVKRRGIEQAITFAFRAPKSTKSDE